MNSGRYTHIILMKVGPYCGYSLDEIIDIKKKEDSNLGRYFWGYSGVFCRPYVIRNLISNSGDGGVKILFVETKSSFIPSTVEKFESYSEDGDEWKNLPEDVLLVGNKKKSHFAITGRNLEKVDFELNLSDYSTLKGVFPNENQSFDRYFRYRVDKACGVYMQNRVKEIKLVSVKYVSDLVSPFSVYIK